MGTQRSEVWRAILKQFANLKSLADLFHSINMLVALFTCFRSSNACEESFPVLSHFSGFLFPVQSSSKRLLKMRPTNVLHTEKKHILYVTY